MVGSKTIFELFGGKQPNCHIRRQVASLLPTHRLLWLQWLMET
jgi:hypothetical protein